jgi:hypothetical protein
MTNFENQLDNTVQKIIILNVDITVLRKITVLKLSKDFLIFSHL